ncbi:MAG: MotA/TolQ/ExbB proton channel family protein, partial [Myxococcota bacterium]
GTGDPRLLSDGISEALITTQLGLAVAVPALLLHTGFLRWAGALFAKIEDACVSLLHHLEDLELPRERVVHHDDESHHHHG